jgi:hypothetical protein
MNISEIVSNERRISLKEVNEMKIELMQESKDYLNEVFNQYEEVDKLPNVLGKTTLIHMYPVEDTRDSSGELHGFTDALLCNVHIYNTKEMICKKTYANKDELMIDVPCRVRVFKDGSTMIILFGDIMIGDTQSMWVREVN